MKKGHRSEWTLGKTEKQRDKAYSHYQYKYKIVTFNFLTKIWLALLLKKTILFASNVIA